MHKFMILKYLKNVSTNDIIDFGNKNNLEISEYEAKLLLETANNNLDDLLYNPTFVFNDLYNKMDYMKVKKIEELFFYYKNKYASYL